MGNSRNKKITGSFLYQVSANGKISHLYGSSHWKLPGVTGDLSYEAKCAFENSKNLVLECWSDNPLDELYFAVAVTKWKWQYETEMSLHFKQEAEKSDASEFIKIFNACTTTPILHYNKLYGEKMMKKLGCEQTLEAFLVDKAKELSIPHSSLENRQQINNTFAALGLSFTEQLQVVEQIFPQMADEAIDLNIKMFSDAVLTRDIHACRRLAIGKLASCPESSTATIKYRCALFDEREEKMAAAIEQASNAGDAFIVVGAAHLPAIIEQLSLLGSCKITPVPETSLSYTVSSCRLKRKMPRDSLRDNSLFNPKSIKVEAKIKEKDHQVTRRLAIELLPS